MIIKDRQTAGINISISVIVARSWSPAEVLLAFNVAVCIVAGLYIVLFSALKHLLSTKLIWCCSCQYLPQNPLLNDQFRYIKIQPKTIALSTRPSSSRRGRLCPTCHLIENVSILLLFCPDKCTNRPYFQVYWWECLLGSHFSWLQCRNTVLKYENKMSIKIFLVFSCVFQSPFSRCHGCTSSKRNTNCMHWEYISVSTVAKML